ncbi:MAG: 3-methyl-2-oxobutanoate hydroxymethyltransferase, partial [Gammaproteobacteria bacterium]|nr:3-methyl-2-oxobutanoate hydroxymethyltransferase [Gammaproteobacteria bacterium]
SDGKPVTAATLQKMKQAGEKFACLTAYDASFAAMVDAAGVEVVLVGDSLGMVMQGHSTTVPVTVDDIIYHGKMVARGLSRALLMLDMPFMSYATPDDALHNAARMMQEGGAHMVKLEGHANQLPVVEYLSGNGVPVCAHLGLKPQSVHKLGGFKVQGRDTDSAKQMVADAKALVDAGADVLLLECVPNALAKEITGAVDVPVIGIGAGPDTDGQILVLYDILDITPGRKPKFAKNYMAGAGSNAAAVEKFVAEVKSGDYPAAEHCFD